MSTPNGNKRKSGAGKEDKKNKSSRPELPNKKKLKKPRLLSVHSDDSDFEFLSTAEEKTRDAGVATARTAANAATAVIRPRVASDLRAARARSAASAAPQQQNTERSEQDSMDSTSSDKEEDERKDPSWKRTKAKKPVKRLSTLRKKQPPKSPKVPKSKSNPSISKLPPQQSKSKPSISKPPPQPPKPNPYLPKSFSQRLKPKSSVSEPPLQLPKSNPSISKPPPQPPKPNPYLPKSFFQRLKPKSSVSEPPLQLPKSNPSISKPPPQPPKPNPYLPKSFSQRLKPKSSVSEPPLQLPKSNPSISKPPPQPPKPNPYLPKSFFQRLKPKSSVSEPPLQLPKSNPSISKPPPQPPKAYPSIPKSPPQPTKVHPSIPKPSNKRNLTTKTQQIPKFSTYFPHPAENSVISNLDTTPVLSPGASIDLSQTEQINLPLPLHLKVPENLPEDPPTQNLAASHIAKPVKAIDSSQPLVPNPQVDQSGGHDELLASPHLQAPHNSTAPSPAATVHLSAQSPPAPSPPVKTDTPVGNQPLGLTHSAPEHKENPPPPVYPLGQIPSSGLQNGKAPEGMSRKAKRTLWMYRNGQRVANRAQPADNFCDPLQLSRRERCRLYCISQSQRIDNPRAPAYEPMAHNSPLKNSFVSSAPGKISRNKRCRRY